MITETAALRWGLTGGIGCGKSTAAEILGQEGWRVIDTDAVAHQLMGPGQANYKNVVDAFGQEILNTDRTVNRRVLGELVFRQPSLREKLNHLTHPNIREVWRRQRAAFREAHPDQPVAVMIPLLFEADITGEFDRVVCVGCSEAVQRERLHKRGWDDEHCQQRLASQWTVTEKMNRSDRVIWNEGSLDGLREQLRLLK